MKKLIVIVCLFLNGILFGQIKTDPFTTHIDKALELKKADKLKEAIVELRQIENKSAITAKDLNNKATALILLMTYNKVAKDVNSSIAFDDTNIKMLALKNANSAIALNKNNGDYYLTRAKIKNEFLQQSDSALSDLNKSILLKNANIDALIYRAKIYDYSPNLHCIKSINDYSQLIKLDSSQRQFYYEKRADCYTKINKLDSAVQDLSYLINNYSNLKYYQLRGDQYIKLKKYQLGINDYTEIISKRSTDKDIKLKRADAYYNNNNLDNAFFEYTNIKMDFDMASMNKEIAKTLNKKYSTSLTQLDLDKSDKFLDIAKNDILWPYQLKTEDDKKFYGQIKAALSNSLKANPYQYNAYFWAAELEFAVANYEDAKKNYLAANEIMSLNPEFINRAKKCESIKSK